LLFEGEALMKKMGLAIAAVLFISALCSMAEAAMIWSDGFESGDFSAWTSASGNWTMSGGNVHSGLKRAQVFGPCAADGDVLLLSRSLAGDKNVTLDYWYRVYKDLENDDFIFVEWTPNGLDWLALTTYSNIVANTDWQEATFLLPSGADDNPLFEFRLRAKLNSGVASDCVYFDDFMLIPEPASVFLFFSCFFSAIVRRKH